MGKNGIECDPEKIAKVMNWPMPEAVDGIRSFLGLANYYKLFIKNFSTIAKPLTALKGEGKQFQWDDSCSASFHALKVTVTSAPVLAYP